MPAIDRSNDDCRGVTVEPKLGRWHTTSADGMFILDARVGPVVEDSKFVSKMEGKQRGKTEGKQKHDSHHSLISRLLLRDRLVSDRMRLGTDDAYVVKTFSGNCLAQEGATYTLESLTHWSVSNPHHNTGLDWSMVVHTTALPATD